MIRKTLFLLLGILMLPVLVVAGPTIPGFYGTIAPTLRTVPANQLPVPYKSPTTGQPGLLYGISGITQTTNQMTIFQNQSQAIIDWSSFDIGSNASVYFNQKGNANWACLNRIWDSNPSQILGSLTADGKIYLINQNGILFGPNSQVNVNGLVASSLNLSIDNFLSNTLHFSSTATPTMNNSNITTALQGTFYTVGGADPFYDTSATPGPVTNAGTITATFQGSVFLIAPTVENSGNIYAPSGQIGLIAATDVELDYPLAVNGQFLTYPGGDTRIASIVTINDCAGGGCIATNDLGGTLEADTGLVGMYGNIVNQNGIIRSVGAVLNGGHVELQASDLIVTGPGSVTSTPVSSSPVAYDPFPAVSTVESDITLTGLIGLAEYQAATGAGGPGYGASLIEHYGAIISPSGLVTMNAKNRVYVATGSQTDVSGLWVNENASAGLLQVQLNTANLRDDYLQKGGVLQGQNVDISVLTGSAIGDVSGSLATQMTTAVQRHTAGGTVNISSQGDIIVGQGSLVNISGGGINYGAGTLNTTKLVSAGKVYDISSASANLDYSSILNSQAFTNSRFGTTHTYNGVYYGGAVPVNEYSQAYIVGSAAGTLSLQAPTVILDGTILGFATNGLQQVLAADPTNSAGNQSAMGFAEVQGGTLLIGGGNGSAGGLSSNNAGDTTEWTVQSIVVTAGTTPALPSTFQPTTPLSSTTSLIPAATLSNAGLGTVRLAADTTITVAPGAQVTLNPGGSFQAVARRIENKGGITVPGGTISLSIQADVTSNPTIYDGTAGSYAPNQSYVPLDEAIYLAPGSSLVAAGERINDIAATASSAGIVNSSYLKGGSISVMDQTVTGLGVFMAPTALIDVSGGWQVSTSGKVTGGDAGSVALQGSTLVVGGTLKGASLLGNKGGSITMTAPSVIVAASPAAFPAGFDPDNVATGQLANVLQSLNSYGQLTLGAHQLDESGFANVTLNSVNDIALTGGTIGPSLVKLAMPMPAGGSQGVIPGVQTPAATTSGTTFATQDQIGPTSVALFAGVTGSGMTSGDSNGGFNNYGNYLLKPQAASSSAEINIGGGTTINTSPTGSITVSAPIVDIAGTLNAPAGTIRAGSTAGDLTLESTAKLLAEGYDQPGTTALLKGLPAQATPLAGGTISLAAAGTLYLMPAAEVSVEGSQPVNQLVIGNDGTLSFISNAAPPGTINLSATSATSTISGLSGALLNGQAQLPGLQGGTLSVSGSTLALPVADLARFASEGFDSLSLSMTGSLILSGSGSVAFGRGLTLSAGQIVDNNTGAVPDQITLSAPWVQLTGGSQSSLSALSGGSAQISLVGKGNGDTGWLDVTGTGAMFSGFQSVTLGAAQDMTFSSSPGSTGLLATGGDLTLQAARIYPTTQSSFGINAAGKVTILPSGAPVSPTVYSVAGSLAIASAGAGIDQEGYLAAPLGTISLNAQNGRVYLGSGSTTTVAAGNIPLLYGFITLSSDGNTLGDNIWAASGGGGTLSQVQAVPSQSVSLKGNEVIVAANATVDVSGGSGSIFTSRFVPSYSGSNNLLVGSYVIVPGVALPGNAVYLSGIKGLPAGTYSLLPATTMDVNGNVNPSQYAYLPGAMVITDLKTTLSTSKATFTADGYPIVGGYATSMGTSISSPVLEAYEVRPASLVLSEGLFYTQSMTAGAAGSVYLSGNTSVVNGAIKASSLPGYPGGSITLSGNQVMVQQTAAPLPAGFGFDTPLPAGLADTLTIAAPSLSGQGFETIGLGVTDFSGSSGSVAATSVEIMPNVILQAENVILGASNTIKVDAGAQILALALPGDTGQATFISPGTLSIGPNAVVHASNAINLQTANTSIDPSAILKADHSDLNLRGTNITFIPDGTAGSATGLFITPGEWQNWSANFENIGLIATGSTSASNPVSPDIAFQGANFNLSVTDTLTLDAGRITDSGTNSNVSLTAQTIVLQNSSGITGSPASALGGQITFNAPQIQANQGSLLFDGFSNVNLNGGGNVTFRGVGSLNTNGGNLTISSPRVATSYYGNSGGTYTAANYTINAGSGTVNMQGTGAASASAAAPGGTLAVNAGEIDISTIVEVPAGQIDLTATKSATSTGNIDLYSGGQLLALGNQYSPGGVVSLTSTGGGAINIASGAVIDVSAGSQGDAGSISLYAPIAGVTLNGSIYGVANGGKGGSFSIVTNTLDAVNSAFSFAALNSVLNNGGFTGTLNFEASYGNIDIPSGQTVTGQNVTISADGTNPDGSANGGSISLEGTINVSEAGQGGTVALYAQKDLTISPSGYINAGATDAGTNPNARGGSVTLSVNTGRLSYAGGTIDVSGAPDIPNGPKHGGTVTFIDPPLPPGGNAQSDMSLSGTIKGASSVVAQIDEVYGSSSVPFQDPNNANNTLINASAISQINSDVSNLMAQDANLLTDLPQGLTLTDQQGNILTPAAAAAIFHLQPGVVIESSGNITVSAPTLSQNTWNLSTWRFGAGSEPGTLTLRAGGNLDIQSNITDNPLVAGALSSNNYQHLLSTNYKPSWSYNLVAGANTNSADPLAVMPASVQGAAGGDLVIGTSPKSGNVVYTQSGAIQFASGGDTTIYPNTVTGSTYMIAASMPYSLATYKGNIDGTVGGNLVIYPKAAIQSATGSINIRVEGDLNLNGGGSAAAGTDLGAIRTTGEHQVSEVDAYNNLVLDANGNPIPNSYQYTNYYAYYNGGSITLDVGGSVVGGLDPNAWLYSGSGQSIPVQGLTYYPVIADYGQNKSFTEGIAAMGGGSVSVTAGGDFDCQVGAFGQGNLQVYSGGNVTGRFLVKDGTGAVSAMGNFGSPSLPQLIEMGWSKVSVSAQGDLDLGQVVNPNLAEGTTPLVWDNGYAPYSSISLTSVTGDVNMYGSLAQGTYGTISTVNFLPPSVRISAGKDIVVMGGFTQLPAGYAPDEQGIIAYYGLNPNALPYGSLTMEAEGSILFQGNGAQWAMSDNDLNAVYPTYPKATQGDTSQPNYYDPSADIAANTHASTPVYTGDPTPVSISAKGDITGMKITTLPEMANISAGGTITGLYYVGQNVSPSDVTTITASGDIIYGSTTTFGVEPPEIQLGGPGYLVVQAGGQINLGTSFGIQTVGSVVNPYALSGGETGASLIVAAGVASPVGPNTMPAFFGALEAAGVEYTNLKNSGDAAGAAAVISRVRASTIEPLLAQGKSNEDITMTSSQITTAGGGSMYLVATGTLNVGTTLLTSPSQSSNPTSTGILTETGGAINIFTVEDVNVNQSRVMTFQGGDITVWSDQGNINAGKGSKETVSTTAPQHKVNPDGSISVVFSPPAVGSGIRALTYASSPTTPAPPEGNIFLFAPQGVIDAGEAGIGGATVVLGATQILNASNISFTTGSVGLPAQGTVSLGALSGTSDMSKSTVSGDMGGALSQAQDRVASVQAIEDMVVKWIDVKVMSYDLTFGSDSSDTGEGPEKKEHEK